MVGRGQQDFGTTFRDHKLLSEGRVIWIQRHESASSFENRQKTNDLTDATVEAKGNDIAHTYSLLDQGLRNTVRHAIEFLVRQRLSFELERREAWRSLGLFFDQAMEASLLYSHFGS